MSSWWHKVEERRKRLETDHGLHISRAELARMAGISESTATKGVKAGSKPTGAVRRQIEQVLEAQETAAEAEGRAA